MLGKYDMIKKHLHINSKKLVRKQYKIFIFYKNLYCFQPERDPNAPKKPCNAFFLFCQEQRPLVVAEANSEMGAELSKPEVTRQLASRWRSLSTDEKRVSLCLSVYY